MQRCASFYFCSARGASPGCAFLTRQKGTKKRPKGLPLWEPLYGKGLCGPYPQWRQAAVMVRPTGHVPPANAAKQVGRKYEWRHLPLRGSRRRHFTVFQYQPPGRQPFGLKVKSPRAFGPAPLPEGGPWGDRLHPIQGPKRQPGTVHETSGGPGCRAPREDFRFAELPTALPGGERRLGTVHETSGGPSRSPPAQPVALEGSRDLPGQSLATFF